MTTIDVRTPSGGTAGSVELPAEIFDVQVNIPLIHQVVVAQLAAARQGTHDTKTRGEVSGGGRKPYKQKGTGRARQGSTRAPQFAGGGVVHGPSPRDYAQRTPKKMKAAALRGALSDRAREGRIHVVSSLVEGDVPSTKTAVALLAGVSGRKHVLVVLERSDDLSWKSLRNHDRAHLIAPDQLNTYDVLVSDDVVFTEAALAAFLSGPSKGKGAKAVASSAEVETPVAAAPAPVEKPAPAPVEEPVEAPVEEPAAEAVAAADEAADTTDATDGTESTEESA
ncbi:MAG: large subunit ribosomal protein [Frankiales bacterium]|nr:large subunit ribosomal protein [Frankiales bacterium]